MRWSTTTAAALGAALALTAGCATTARATPAEPAPAVLAWAACPMPDVVPDLECASMEVPADWAEPGGRTITLDLARAKATGSDRTGAVIMNPGGPGIRGIQFLDDRLETVTGLRTRMDVVTWNPRGSDGRYLPMDECILGPTVTNPENRDEYVAAAAAAAAAMQPCRDTDPQLFDNLDSASSARDMDAIRAAIGENELNYIGNSYGGTLGATYARLFPERVRTMFLDSIVGHVSGTRVRNKNQYLAYELLFARFGTWCETAPDCRQRGQDVEKAWQQLLATAERTPIPMVGSNPPVALDADRLKSAATGFVVHPETWPQFSAAIEAAAAGDAALFDMSGQGQPVPPHPAAGLATTCADGSGFTDYDDYAAALEESRALSPNFAGERESYTATCAGWHLPPANPAGPLPGAALPPLLGAGPVLEYADVRATIDQVPGSVAIRFENTGHGLYLNEGNRCVIGHADRYLIDGVLPPEDTVCPPDQQ